jgi:hypothetical protein
MLFDICDLEKLVNKNLMILARWKAYQSLQRHGPETNNNQFTLFDLCDLEK